jgi:hypothetical protein
MRGYPASLQYGFRKTSDSVGSCEYPVASVLTEDVWAHTECPAGAREIRFSASGLGTEYWILHFKEES